MTTRRSETIGYLLGLAAVTAFAITLPATRIAVRALDPVFVGLGRCVFAALLAVIFLFAARARFPSLEEAKRLVIVSAGVVIGFPIFTALAMRYVDASHGGVVLGVLPLATAIAAALLLGERPSRAFWAFATVGAAIVVGYSLTRASGVLGLTDLALFGAIASAAIGYAEGTRLSQSLGGLKVISWALVIAAPFLLVPVILTAPPPTSVPVESWIGFLYLIVVSQFFGFIPWYRALALGGIAKVSQLQLLQPFLTILASGLLLGEPGDLVTWIVALLVAIVVALSRNARVTR